MRQKIKLLSISVILLAGIAGKLVTAIGQSPYFRLHPIGDPYMNATVKMIYEDPHRWIWFGAEEGLLRYDGQKVVSYLKEDSTSNQVSAVYRDQKDILWVGYRDGSIYQIQQQQLISWQPEEGVPVVPITGFVQDDSSRFWIATYGEGVYCYQNNRLYNFDTDDGLLGNDVYCMILDTDNRIWIGTDRGISICSFEKGEKKIRNLTKKDGLSDDIVRSLKLDHRGNCWIGFYDHGICYYDTQSDSVLLTTPDWTFGPINDLEVIQDNEVIIGTESNGLIRYKIYEAGLSRMDIEQGASNAKIYDLTIDSEGNLWGVSNNHGIFSANLQFELLPTILNKIQALTLDHNAFMWLGTEKGLYTNFSSGDSTQVPFREVLTEHHLNVISLYEDNAGILWIGTFGEGIYCYDPVRNKIRHLTEKDGLTNGSVLSIAGLGKKVWLATLGGVTEFNYQKNVITDPVLKFRNYNSTDGLGTNFIYTVFVDSKERVWFATDGEGISVLDQGSISNFNQIKYKESGDSLHSIELQAVYSITEDHDGNIWLSTAKDGIFKFDGNCFYRLAVKQGLRNLAITSLITDKNGKILIVHPAGIDLLDPQTHHLIYYGNEVGIQGLDPNLNAFCKTHEGQIWIADQSKLLLFNPLNEQLVIHPGMQLTGVMVNYEPIAFTNNNRFSHTNNNFVFKYKGLWYTNPAIVKYKYRLREYDPVWIESRDEAATYSNLPPGRYTFEVASTENEAWADEPVTSYSFTIKAPLWQKAWFLILAVLAMTGLFLYFLKLREGRIQRWTLLEKEKIESQLAALKAQINPHFLFNSFNTLIDSIEENPGKAIEYVEKLSDFYRSVLKYRDDQVIPLAEEVNLLHDFEFLLKKRFGENLEINVGFQSLDGFIPPLTLQLLIENAVKHNIISKAKPLRVNITKTEDNYLSVTNNMQPKINREPSTHFGLQGLIKRYDLLGNYPVKITSRQDYFSVSIPIIEKPII